MLVPAQAIQTHMGGIDRQPVSINRIFRYGELIKERTHTKIMMICFRVRGKK